MNYTLAPPLNFNDISNNINFLTKLPYVVSYIILYNLMLVLVFKMNFSYTKK